MMGYFEEMEKKGHEQVMLCHDKASNLRAIIAIHNTILGPSLGGCRMWPFKTEEEAVEDALRLSRGMTYKNAAAGLNIGGGKAVIIADPRKDKTEALFRAFGQYVESLGGRYITAEDLGTCVEDMEAIRMETAYVTGLSKEKGGAGDPSPYTALGVLEGIRASIKYKFGKTDLQGVKVAVQGCGHVAYYLCEYLHEAGAELVVSDIYQDKTDKIVEDFHATAVKPEDICKVEADIFSPCALGSIINDQTIPQMKFGIIAGAANNQLLNEKKHSQMLKEKGILYAPDFIINAGGVVDVYFEAINEYKEPKISKKVKEIYQTVSEVYSIAEKEKMTTSKAAEKLAERRIEQIAGIHQKFLHSPGFTR